MVLLPSALFVLLHVAYLVAAKLSTQIDPANTRLLYPMYVPMLAIVAVAVDRSISEIRSRRLRSMRRWPVVILVVLISAQSAGVARQVRAGLIGGIGWNSDRFLNSEVASAAGESDTGERIYSNQIRALWAATGMQPLSGLAYFEGTAEVNGNDPLGRFSGALACADIGSLVVIYTDDSQDGSFSVTELATVANMEPVGEYPDGRIFRATAREGIVCSAG